MDKILVIGNGFDLAICAKTAYRDFFNSDYYRSTKEEVEDWLRVIDEERSFTAYLYHIAKKEYSFNCWDLLFCMESFSGVWAESENSIAWCDVERVIHDSITKKGRRVFNWDTVYAQYKKAFVGDLFSGDNLRSIDNEKVRAMASYIAIEEEEKCLGKEEFVSKLLEDLSEFEIAFGRYIIDVTRSGDYTTKARDSVNKLLGKERDILIDSFNYSDFSNGNIEIRHINGDSVHPIFGIFLSESEESRFKEYNCFTKTARRLQQDAYNYNRNTNWAHRDIGEAVVYGHSLNNMDYDYYNYLFTVLKFNTRDLEQMGKVSFVYKVYDTNRQNEIRASYADAVYDLINHYEQSICESGQHVLLNLLRFSGKLRIIDWNDLL